MPLIPNLSLYLIQKFDRLALWGNLTILELHFAETQARAILNKIVATDVKKINSPITVSEEF